MPEEHHLYSALLITTSLLLLASKAARREHTVPFESTSLVSYHHGSRARVTFPEVPCSGSPGPWLCPPCRLGLKSGKEAFLEVFSPCTPGTLYWARQCILGETTDNDRQLHVQYA